MDIIKQVVNNALRFSIFVRKGDILKYLLKFNQFFIIRKLKI